MENVMKDSKDISGAGRKKGIEDKIGRVSAAFSRLDGQ
jgi:hypothetical protein